MDGRQVTAAMPRIELADAGAQADRVELALGEAARRRAMVFAVTGGALVGVGLPAHRLFELSTAAARLADRAPASLRWRSLSARDVLDGGGGDLEAALGAAVAHLCLWSTAEAARLLEASRPEAFCADALSNAALQHVQAAEVGWRVLEVARPTLPEDVRAMLSADLVGTLATVWRGVSQAEGLPWTRSVPVDAARQALATAAVPRLEELGFAAVRAWRMVDAPRSQVPVGQGRV